MSDVLQIKTAPGHWSVFVGGVCVGGYGDEADANCVYRAIDSALAQARLAAIDECLSSAYHWRDFVGPGPWQEHIEKLKSLKEKPE